MQTPPDVKTECLLTWGWGVILRVRETRMSFYDRLLTFIRTNILVRFCVSRTYLSVHRRHDICAKPSDTLGGREGTLMYCLLLWLNLTRSTLGRKGWTQFTEPLKVGRGLRLLTCVWKFPVLWLKGTRPPLDKVSLTRYLYLNVRPKPSSKFPKVVDLILVEYEKVSRRLDSYLLVPGWELSWKSDDSQTVRLHFVPNNTQSLFTVTLSDLRCARSDPWSQTVNQSLGP